jgi:hypothetical protein
MPSVYEEQPDLTGATNSWRNRVVEHAEVDPIELSANPRNWRCHPRSQQEAIAAVLNEIGWVAPVMVNRTSGFVVDGHARVALAIQRGETAVPVDYVDLTDLEEAMVIATYDPIATLAGMDAEAIKYLVADVGEQPAEIKNLLNKLPTMQTPDLSPGQARGNTDAKDDGDDDDDESATRSSGGGGGGSNGGSAATYRREVELQHKCPDCGHEWDDDDAEDGPVTVIGVVASAEDGAGDETGDEAGDDGADEAGDDGADDGADAGDESGADDEDEAAEVESEGEDDE